MTMHRKVTTVFLQSTIAALVLSAVLAASASASPGWEFNGSAPMGSETILGDAIESTLTIPGLTTTCDYHYKMTISNSAGTATAKITELSIGNCFTNSSACTVEWIEAEKLPWSVAAKLVSSKSYVFVSGVKVSLIFSGPECVLSETLVTVTGSAGGLFDNTAHTITFDPASFAATGTKLSALGTKVEWEAVFSTEATGFYAGKDLSLL